MRNALLATVVVEILALGAVLVFAVAFVLINLAVGGTWPGSPDSTTRLAAPLFLRLAR